MARGRRGRRRGRRGFRRQRFVTKALLHREMHGSIPRGRFDPPETVSQPWNRVVLAFSFGGSTSPATLYVENVVSALRVQLGLNSADSRFYLRIERFDTWYTLGADLTFANFAACAASLRQPPSVDSSTSYYVFYRWLEDRGTLTRPAHLHWIWPTFDSQFIIDTYYHATKPVMKIDAATEKPACTLHLHIMWRLGTGDPVPSFRRHIGQSALSEDFEKIDAE